jgi:ABC-type bacteriocin/lantibiotic exporter with double-glycine peptidase domain
MLKIRFMRLPPRAEKIAIVGLNGAGKTTLMKLMLRLLEPDQGGIRFRGIDLKQRS